MLTALIGNKSIQTILLFLLVNEKCYATQLAKQLAMALTPLQKALLRLEKGGILTSTWEGKTRFFHWNPAFPLQNELEGLLKKTYSLLSAQEKKQLHYVRKDLSIKTTMPLMQNKDERALVMSLWKRLCEVKQLSFSSKSKSKNSSQNRTGKGEVRVTKEGNHACIFHEQGDWWSDQGESFHFTNVFRWTIDPVEKIIGLEHLRLGANRPVFLVQLIPTGPDVLESLHPHLCEKDVYFGMIKSSPHFIQLNWRILGPDKNEIIDYLYI